MKKRLLAYLLCITMLLGLIPTMAFAATTLTNIGITGIDAPVADAAPDYTAGVTPTTFAPNDDCTRAQIVSFLYRALNK